MYRKPTTLFLFCLLIATTLAQVSFKGGHCPLKNTVNTCTPRCVSDYQCSLNQKCCPNKCGTQSCASPSPFATSDGGYKGDSDSRVSCGGVKCSRYEKCEFDKKTKREKCVRT